MAYTDAKVCAAVTMWDKLHRVTEPLAQSVAFWSRETLTKHPACREDDVTAHLAKTAQHLIILIHNYN